MTREEAIEVVKERLDYYEREKRLKAACEVLIPELAESEDERIIRLLRELGSLDAAKELYEEFNLSYTDVLYWLEKQKEIPEKEYVFRPLAGTDITIAAEQAIRRANEGDRLVLAFNGWYVPVDKHATTKGLVDSYDTFIEKQKDLDKMIVVTPEVWDNAINEAYENGKKDNEKQKPELVRHSPITYTYNSNASRDERLQAALLALLGSDLIQVNDGGYFTKQDLIEWVKKKPSGLSEEDVKMIGRLRSVVNECASYNDALDVNGDYCEGDYAKLDDWLKSLPLNLKKKNDDVAKLCSNEWSEEDERMLKWIEDILLIADGDLSDKLNGKVSPITDSAYSSMKLCIAKCLSWLKFLKPSWKPSEVCYGPKGDPDPAGVWKPSEGQQGVEPLTKLEKAVFDMLVERTNEITISEKQARKYAPIFLAIVKDEILGEHWKPSEEQMKAMGYFVRKHQATANHATTTWPEFEAFKSLYQDLKKL